MNNKTGAAIALVLILAGAVAIGYFAFKDEIAEVLGFLPSESCVGYEITVRFEDGTSKTFKQSSASLTPLSITISGREIKGIYIDLKATLVTSGTVSSWSVTGTRQIEMYKKPQTVPKTSSTGDVAASGSSWPSGEEKQIDDRLTIEKKTIEDVAQQYGDGTYQWQVIGRLTVDATFSDGKTQKASTSAIGRIDFTYVAGGIQSFTVTVQVNAFSIV